MYVAHQNAGVLGRNLLLEVIQRRYESLLDGPIPLFNGAIASLFSAQVASRSRIGHQHELDEAAFTIGQFDQGRIGGHVKAAGRVCAVILLRRRRGQVEGIAQRLKKDFIVVIAADGKNRPAALKEWQKYAL